MISVIIIVRNMQNPIGSGLEALMNQTIPRDKYEVIVVDNNSTDNTQEVVKRYPVKLVIEEEVGNFGKIRNRGIEASEGDIIAFTDADCIPERNWLEKMLTIHRLSPQIAGIGGAATNLYPKSKVARTITYAQAGHWTVRAPKRRVDYLPGCNSSYKRHTVEEAGLFPEASPSEDILLGEKMRRNGQILLFDPDPKVQHMFETTLKKLGEKEERSGKGHYRIVSANHPHASWIRLVALSLFSPILILGRIGTGLRRVILYSDSKADVFILLPYLVYSGFYWTKGYLKRAFETRKK